MEAILTINDFPFHLYAIENGITQSISERQGKSFVSLDGTLYQKGIKKKIIEYEAVEISFNTLQSMLEAVNSNPVTVTYLDDLSGARTALFYVSNVSASAKKVVGGNTYYSGFGFTLTEQ